MGMVACSASATELMIQELPLEAPVQEEVSAGPVLSSTQKEEGSLDALYTQLDLQSVALREFTERLEQTEHRLKEMEDKLERINQDVSFRLNELETKATNPPVIIDKMSDKERYDYAYELLKKENYDEAETQFLAFLKDFEKSDLRPNVMYWLGETYYARKQYESAAVAFATGFKKYEKNAKAPDNLLKLGLSMQQLGKNKEACTAFKNLKSKFPKASDVVLSKAKKESDKLGCEK